MNSSEAKIHSVVNYLNTRLSQQTRFLKELNLVLIKQEMEKGHNDAPSFLRGLITSIEQQRKYELFIDLKLESLELLKLYEGMPRVRGSEFLYQRLAHGF